MVRNWHSLLLLLLLVGPILAKKDNKNLEENGSNDVREEPERPQSPAEDAEGDEDSNAGPKDYSNGFGADIDWVPFDQATSIALDLNRPILLLIHKTWCGACQALKKSFITSPKRKELLELSKRFVMVNTEDDDEPEEEEYAPDGRYIPRLFILDKHGKRLPVDNAENFPSNIAYFPQVPDVIRAMKEGLELFEGPDEKADTKKKTEKKEEKPKKETKEEEKPKKEKKEEEKPKKKSAEPAKKTKKEAEAGEDEAAAGKGGCPHAAGKAAAAAKKKEQEKKAAAEKKKGEEKKAAAEKKKAEEKKTEEAKKEEKKEKTDPKKMEQQKKKKAKEDPKKEEL